jgi:phosphate transport system protein
MQLGAVAESTVDAVPETRHHFHEDLRELEVQALGGLDMVLEALDRALESIRRQDLDLAAMVIADDDRIDGRYLAVHQGVLSMLALQAPVATDLRLVTALLHIIRCVERMGDQCVNIAKLVLLSGSESARDAELLSLIDRLGQLTRSHVFRAKAALVTRDVAFARVIMGEDMTIFRLNRQIVNRAVEIGDDLDVRERAMFMVLVARALERIAENSVDIAEQTVFVVTGSFREPAHPAPHPA